MTKSSVPLLAIRSLDLLFASHILMCSFEWSHRRWILLSVSRWDLFPLSNEKRSELTRSRSESLLLPAVLEKTSSNSRNWIQHMEPPKVPWLTSLIKNCIAGVSSLSWNCLQPKSQALTRLWVPAPIVTIYMVVTIDKWRLILADYTCNNSQAMPKFAPFNP